ncbi:TIGR02594 family protein [Methylobacterium dankookense]|uniref:Peptidoglycan binding-like domain-containing protein n=1 Tax=Methylobacterium dankookense TaxID=560405 RepID=A0A564G7L6_9HYPH|nr:TIGR02594 family protein [Methylobacterium dankookense]GJD59292.1 hypothetical protein IFDJLNFL_5220 [Methylobacterium dankookense]VUF16016.1 hypothetical protein MTDSW087_05765 [Methylobacterium dankookense]
MKIDEIQRALIARGYDLGKGGPSGKGDDGRWGRLSIAGTKAFQAAEGLKVTGVADAGTLTRLFPSAVTKPAPIPPWYAEARRKMGLHEVRNRSVLMAWLRSDGKTLGDPAKLPWCGDFVETCIALTLPEERMVANPYYALNWLQFGMPLAIPAIGAVLVFKRTGGGHVGFYAGERSDAYRVLGGNQSNQVSETWVEKARCQGIRWPSTAAAPSGGRVMVSASGALSTNEA